MNASLLVILQFTTLSVLYLHAYPLLSSRLGITFFLLGILAGIWAMTSLGRLSFRVHPVPKENAELRRNGAYRFLRHPMYAIVIAIGIAIVWMNPTGLAFFSLICATIVLHFKIKLEERLLEERFPDYAQYASVTPSLIPIPPRHTRLRGGLLAILIGLAFPLLAWRVIERQWDKALFASDSIGQFVNLSTAETAILIAQEPDLLILDVRSNWEFGRSRIHGAMQCSAGRDALSSLAATSEKDRPTLVYCAAGFRSRIAFGRLKELGFSNLYHLNHGIWDWQLKGWKTDSASLQEPHSDP